jgi:hypothetical protein
MRYWLHPEAENDLRHAAEFYRESADSSLSQSLLAEFERSVDVFYNTLALARSGAMVGAGSS